MSSMSKVSVPSETLEKSDREAAAKSKIGFLFVDTSGKEISGDLTDIENEIDKLNIANSQDFVKEREEQRNSQMQTPPPFSTHELNLTEDESTTPPALFQNPYSKISGLRTPEVDTNVQPLGFRRNISSPAGLDDSLRIEKKTISSPFNMKTIPQSPAANVLQHSLLTPITRNTQAFDPACLLDVHRAVVSPHDERTGDILSTLAIPGSSDDFNPTPNPILSFSVHHPSLNSLPDEIIFSSDHCEVSNESPTKAASRNSESPTHGENLRDSFAQEKSAYYNNVSAPSEFFENLAYNNMDQLGGSLHSTRTELSSLFASPEIPTLTRGTSLDRPKRKEHISPHYAQMEPRLQYQPSRRDGSVGISKNTKGVDDIFTQRSPVASSDIEVKLVLERPIALDERQLSIPSLHRANCVGNDSTASFTDGEYSWEDEEVSRNIRRDSEDQLPLILSEDLTKVADEDLISSGAVGSVATDNFTRHDDSLLSIEEFTDKESTIVVVEMDEDFSGRIGQTFATSNKGKQKGSKRRGTDALKWINDLQCGSANKVGEAASSKFLTKGISR